MISSGCRWRPRPKPPCSAGSPPTRRPNAAFTATGSRIFDWIAPGSPEASSPTASVSEWPASEETPMSDLQGRVCLVTGATDGHGRAVARALARRGAEVGVHRRNPENCRRVQSEIAAENGGKRPEILICDLASREAIDRAAAEFLSGGRPLHVLVNNAGLVSQARQENAEGIELTFAVDYLAMFQLTLRLLPRLIESAPARIVNVSSDTYRVA